MERNVARTLNAIKSRSYRAEGDISLLATKLKELNNSSFEDIYKDVDLHN
jgi:hypothetical protein